MKVLLGIMSLLSLFILSNACNRDATRSDEKVQREETIRTDDLREKDSFDRNVPTDESKIEEGRKDLNMGPNDSSVTD